MRKSISAYFVTLTYDNEHMTYAGDEFGTLVKRDIQLFMKRLRRIIEIEEAITYNTAKAHEMALSYNRPSGDTTGPLLDKVSQIALKWPKIANHEKRSKTKIKYFITGEYGDNTHRPHYHGIYFNIPLCVDVQKAFQKAWGNGFVQVKIANAKTINYTAKYCISESDDSDRQKHFMLVSKGMGLEYVNRMYDWHKKNKTYYGIKRGGMRVHMPRYYKDKIFDKTEKIESRLSDYAFKVWKESQKLIQKHREQGVDHEQWEAQRKQQIKESIIKTKKSKSKL